MISWKEPALVLAMLVAAPVVMSLAGEPSYAQQRQPLYRVLAELRPGMPRAEVEERYRRHASSLGPARTSERGLQASVSHPLMPDSCSLLVRYRDGVLLWAGIRGEDGPHEIFDDAPPDVGEAPAR